ncbi:MAG TPA: hypothetical protein VE650_02045 [Acetobacteraceae bacterium]|nr:hypothetical protein [Acetobacteraceae bacterium]
MRCIRSFTSALVLTMLGAGAAFAANTCETPKLTCVTTMPLGGYCQCVARGTVEDGEVVSKPSPGRRINATAGGCGVAPNAPGCR